MNRVNVRKRILLIKSKRDETFFIIKGNFKKSNFINVLLCELPFRIQVTVFAQVMRR